MLRNDLIGLFDTYWEEGRYDEAIELYKLLGRVFERCRYVAEYYESRGWFDKAIVEHDYYVKECLKISDTFLPFPSGPKVLFQLGEWFECSDPTKAEKYLRLYLKADAFEVQTGIGIEHKKEAEQCLKRIRKRYENDRPFEG